MGKKKTVGIFFGGQSAEHEISLLSAKNIIEAIDKEKYELVLVGIDKKGKWLTVDEVDFLLNSSDPKNIRLQDKGQPIGIVPGATDYQLINSIANSPLKKLDVIFPVLHGPFGEDGTLQGLLKLINIPFVGPGVLGSAVGMDKDVMKRLMRDAGIPNADFMIFRKNESSAIEYKEVERKLGSPVFIKPANMGSSVGINKAKNEKEFFQYIEEAFRYDTKVVVEKFIKGREIECAVLGNEAPVASVPGEIIAHHDFYSYEAKYLDEHGASLSMPANLPESVTKKVRDLAVLTFKVLCCEGMARVDMFVTEDNKVYVNEINTIPGFTRISMYPKLWEKTGIPYTELLDRLINLALERHQRDSKLQTDVKL